jgi:UDP-N-acetylglucosamine 2-epimerase (non-hydrolysing)
MTEAFSLEPDYDLDLIEENQSLSQITVKALNGMQGILEQVSPDILVVQGDTTSAFASALAAFYLRIPVAHVEAGLRSFDKFQPYPEEINRLLISRIADLNFCPTRTAAANLIAEQIPKSFVHVTGNTVVDALLFTVRLLEEGHEANEFFSDLDLPTGRMVLVTGHRRESFGEGLRSLSLALLDLVEQYADVTVVYSVHPNPNVRAPIEEILGSHDRIRLISPPSYFQFVALMNKSFFIITDSGGIQEEAPTLKKPVLVARSVTERTEAIEAGAARLVGTDRTRIVSEACRLLDDPKHFQSMIVDNNPFGDGHASERIVDLIEEFLNR